MPCNNYIKSENVETRRSRTLPVAPKKSHRSSSLPKMCNKDILLRKAEVKQNAVANVNKSISQSMNTLTRQGKIKAINEETIEIPVIIDEVTKWIRGVNDSTTCDDIIRVILQRETDTFQVRGKK